MANRKQRIREIYQAIRELRKKARLSKVHPVNKVLLFPIQHYSDAPSKLL